MTPRHPIPNPLRLTRRFWMGELYNLPSGKRGPVVSHTKTARAHVHQLSFDSDLSRIHIANLHHSLGGAARLTPAFARSRGIHNAASMRSELYSFSLRLSVRRE